MARTLAVELAPIRANLISPGLVGDSPRWVKRASASPQVAQMLDSVKTRIPARRVAEMADIAHAVFFLMDNRAVNGIDLQVDGGALLV
jgi:NAD(P)-dependent dehydrogenase (short-subunit alcohol dehydrogenase family)